jgi:hypothetical protein
VLLVSGAVQLDPQEVKGPQALCSMFERLLCCEYAALRLLFAHLCNHSAAEGVRLTLDLPDGLTQGRQGKVSMSIYDEAGPPVSYVEEQAVLPSIT